MNEEQQVLAALEQISAQQVAMSKFLVDLVAELRKPPEINTLAELAKLLQPLERGLAELARKLPEPPTGSQPSSSNGLAEPSMQFHDQLREPPARTMGPEGDTEPIPDTLDEYIEWCSEKNGRALRMALDNCKVYGRVTDVRIFDGQSYVLINIGKEDRLIRMAPGGKDLPMGKRIDGKVEEGELCSWRVIELEGGQQKPQGVCR